MVAHKVEPTQCRFGGTPQGLCVPFTRRGAVTRRPRLQGGRAEPRRRPEASRCAHRQRGGSGGRGELYEPDIPWRVMAGLRTRRRARSDPAARLLNRLPRCRRARAAIRDLNVVHHQSLPQPLEATDHQKRARPHARRAAPKVARPFLPLIAHCSGRPAVPGSAALPIARASEGHQRRQIGLHEFDFTLFLLGFLVNSETGHSEDRQPNLRHALGSVKRVKVRATGDLRAHPHEVVGHRPFGLSC